MWKVNDDGVQEQCLLDVIIMKRRLPGKISKKIVIVEMFSRHPHTLLTDPV